jgi:hypothetical protein
MRLSMVLQVFAAPVPSKVDTLVLTLRDHHAAADDLIVPSGFSAWEAEANFSNGI